jgi:hypothetical protein
LITSYPKIITNPLSPSYNAENPISREIEILGDYSLAHGQLDYIPQVLPVLQDAAALAPNEKPLVTPRREAILAGFF